MKMVYWTKACVVFHFEAGTQVFMNNLQCSGEEHRLQDCSYNNGTDSRTGDWGVSCNNGEIGMATATVHVTVRTLPSPS